MRRPVGPIGSAALLSVSVTRRWGGWAAAGLRAFVPADLHTSRVVPEKPLRLTVAAVRLPLQVPLVAAALRVARGG